MSMKAKKKARVDIDHCVACGCCVKVCPLKAIEIHSGIYACVKEEKCAKECPASVIEIVQRRCDDEKKMV